MKKNIGRKKIISILLIILLIITTKVYAAEDSFGTELTVDNAQVKANDLVTVTIGLNNIEIEGGDKGIGGYTGKIEYDTSILEYVSASGTDIWDKPFFSDKFITSTTSNGVVVDTPQSIGTITFKVRSDAVLGKTTIGLENFSGTNGEKDIYTMNKSVEIEVIGNGNGNGNGNNTGNGNNSNENDNNINNKPNNDNSSENQNTPGDIKEGNLPYAGDNKIIVFTILGGCFLLAIVLYIRFRVIDGRLKG